MADQVNKDSRQMVAVEVLQAMYPAEIKSASAEKDIEMTNADTECAQALLELARSFATNHPVNNIIVETNNKEVNCTNDMRSVLNPLSSNKSPPKRKQMHVTVKKLNIGRGSPSKKARKPNKINEFSDAIKRVKLDHTYALPANAVEFQRQVDPAFFSLLDEVEGGGDVDPSKSNKSLIKYSQSVKVAKMKYGANRTQTQAETGVSLPVVAPLDSEDKDGLLKTQTGDSMVNCSVEPDKNGNSKNNMDLYQPDDSKYKNFNLLLKCLTNEGPDDKSSGKNLMIHASETVGNSRKADSQSCDIIERESPQEVKCEHCSKTFLSKIYLRKHKQRMHSNAEFDTKADVQESEICPGCSLNVEKKKMNEHRNICYLKPEVQNNPQFIVYKNMVGSINIAQCQFCSVKLRRPQLLKHLADKHCIENKEDGMLSDSGSSTVSGSDVENKCLGSQDEENIIQCDICFAFVPKLLLSQHVAEKHFNMISGTGYTAGMTGNEQLTYSGGGGSSKALQEVSSQHTSNSSNQDVVLESSQDSDMTSPPSAGAFKQYMLQRFLADNSSSVKKEDMNSFSKNFNNRNSRLSPTNSFTGQMGPVAGLKVSRQNLSTTATNTRGIYTVMVTKEMSVQRTNPGLQRPSPLEQLKL